MATILHLVNPSNIYHIFRFSVDGSGTLHLEYMGDKMNAYFDGLRHYATFRGRATRSQFWLFTLFLYVLVFVGLLIDDAMGTIDDKAALFTGLIFTAHLLPYLAVTVRRLHDVDKSGWWMLISFVPLVGLVAMLVFLCSPSTPGPNRFGLPSGEGAAPAGYPHPGYPAAGTAASSASNVDQLEKLASLRASGAIDEGEFQKMKAGLLGASGRV